MAHHMYVQILERIYPLAFQAEGVLWFPVAVRQSIRLSICP